MDHAEQRLAARGETVDDVGPLPEGWKTRIEPNSGRRMYYHRERGLTRWHRPGRRPEESSSGQEVSSVPLGGGKAVAGGAVECGDVVLNVTGRDDETTPLAVDRAGRPAGGMNPPSRSDRLAAIRQRLIERLKQRDRAAASEPEPAQDDTIELVRAPSARTARRQQREARLRAIAAEVEDTSASAQPLIRTPSAVADMQAAAADQHSTDTINQIASRAQRLRKHLRLVDAELAEVNAELVRARVLRGASGQRFECDENCIVGGCNGEFVEDQGVLCSSCNLFLCHSCFGATVVTSECQVTGRYDQLVGGGVHDPSEPGSLPCPLFPQSCSCGHIALNTIQRAMLHPNNRGRDGPNEDVNSPGLSAHKIHLMARRRQAEADAKAMREASDSKEEDGVALVRTFTDRVARNTIATLARRDAAVGSIVGLADKLEELDELKAELASAPAVCEIAPHLRRRCVQCSDELAAFEGAECKYVANGVQPHSHFLCAVCFGGYLIRACSPGGVFETEIRNEKGVAVSARGQLPCPFFRHLDSQLVPRLGRQQLCTDTAHVAEMSSHSARAAAAAVPGLPAMECRCGAVPMFEIETALLDPRNNSYQYWRHRHGDVIVQSHADSTVDPPEANELPAGWVVQNDQLSGQEVYFNTETEEICFDRPTEGPQWSHEAELLGRGYTPANLHETARLRVAIAEKNEEEAERLKRKAEAAKDSDPATRALAELHGKVEEALVRGGTVRCPQCGKLRLKNDACIHIDTCPCGSSWCYLCGKDQSECPRSGPMRGCDEGGIMLESLPGWGNFAISVNGETAASGAQFEFLMRRQAFMVRAVKGRADPALWAKLREKHPDLLSNTPTAGRNIDWDALDSADMPLFGGHLRRAQERGDVDDAGAQRRLQQLWEQERLAAMLEDLREAQRWRHQMFCIPLVAILGALLVVGTTLLMAKYPPQNPAILVLHAGNEYPDSQVVEPDSVPFSNQTANLLTTNQERLCARDYNIMPVSAEVYASREQQGVMATCANHSGSLHQPCTSITWRDFPPDDTSEDTQVESVRIPILAALGAALHPAQSLIDCQEWCRQSAGCGTWQFHCNDTAWKKGPAESCATGTCVLKTIQKESLSMENSFSPTTSLRSRLKALTAGTSHLYEGTCIDELPRFKCSGSCHILRWVSLLQLVVILLAGVPTLLQSIRNHDNDTVGLMFVAVFVVLISLFPRNIVLDFFQSDGEDLLDLGWFSAYVLVPFFGFAGTAIMLGAVHSVLHIIDGDDIILFLLLPPMVFIVFLVCISIVRASTDLIGVVPTDGTFEFDCDWTCESTILIPRVLGTCGGALFLLSVSFGLVCGGRHREELAQFCAVSVFAAAVALWPASIEAVDFVHMPFFPSYFLTPVCATLLSPLWVLSQLEYLMSNGWVENAIEDFAPVLMCCCGFLPLIWYIVALAMLRSANELLIIPPRVLYDFECEDECLWLSWSPRAMAMLGALCIVITTLCGACGRTAHLGRDTIAIVAFGLCILGAVTHWPLLTYYDPQSLLTAPWMVAYVVLPFFSATLSTIWLLACVMLAVSSIMNQDFRHHERIQLRVLIGSTVAMTIAYIGMMRTLRRTQATELTHAGDIMPNAVEEPEYEYKYECTWPCHALRVFIAAMVGSAALAFAFAARDVLAGRRSTYLVRCCYYVVQVVLLAAFVLAAVEGAIGWPVEMPIELLVTAHAAWIYPLATIISVLVFAMSWKMISEALISAQRRLILEHWDALRIVIAGSGIASTWLVGVLRGSTVFETPSNGSSGSMDGGNDEGEGGRSSRSRILMWECISICYCGVFGLVYFWNLQRAEGRRRASCGIVRTLCLWLPAALWPLLLPIWAEGGTDPIDSIVANGGAIYWLLVCGLSLSAGGFCFEWACFIPFRRARRLGSGVAVFTLLCVMLSTGLLAVNALCVAPAAPVRNGTVARLAVCNGVD